MAIARAPASYCIAADILYFRSGGYDPDGKGTEWESWVDYVRHRICRQNNADRCVNLSQSHDEAGSNGNFMAGAGRIATASQRKTADPVQSRLRACCRRC